MTRVSFLFVPFNRDRTIEQKFTGISKGSSGWSQQDSNASFRMFLPSNPGNHPCRSMLKQEGSKTDFLNRSSQRGIAATTYQGCWIAVGLVKAEDAKPNRTKTTRRSREFL